MELLNGLNFCNYSAEFPIMNFYYERKDTKGLENYFSKLFVKIRVFHVENKNISAEFVKNVL
jgi:hypothetical protein